MKPIVQVVDELVVALSGHVLFLDQLLDPVHYTQLHSLAYAFVKEALDHLKLAPAALLVQHVDIKLPVNVVHGSARVSNPRNYPLAPA